MNDESMVAKLAALVGASEDELRVELGGDSFAARPEGTEGKLPPQEPWKNVEFENGWSNIGAGDQTAQFVKDVLGWVCIRGIIHGGLLTKSAFKLPPLYRPGEAEEFVCLCEGGPLAWINVIPATGECVVEGSAGAKSATFMAIRFWPEK